MMLRSNFSALVNPRFKVLSDDQIKEIHFATLELLERTGVRVENEEAKELLYSHGAIIEDSNTVKIPGGLIEEAIRTTPSRFTVYNRCGEQAMFLEGYKSYFGGATSSPCVADPYTKEVRPVVSKDVANLAKINDYLPNLHFMMPEGHVYDVHPSLMSRVEVFEMLTNAQIPILLQSPGNVKCLDDVVEMAAIIAGGYQNLKKKPSIILYSEPISPLKHVEGLDVALRAIDHGLPVVYTSMPIGGGTAPVTLAGLLLQCNAECLSGLTILQLKKKGHPCIYGGIPNPLDMRTTIFCYGAPEINLLSAALADIGHHYEIPVFGTAGMSEGKEIDAQVGIEYTWAALYAVLSGANLIHDVGYLDHSHIVSMEGHVLMDEIVEGIKHLVGPIEIDKEHLALDVIDKVGFDGNFVKEQHTYDHFRKTWMPNILDRTGYNQWIKNGKVSIEQKLNEKVKDIIENYEPEPLSQEVMKQLNNCRNKWE